MPTLCFRHSCRGESSFVRQAREGHQGDGAEGFPQAQCPGGCWGSTAVEQQRSQRGRRKHVCVWGGGTSPLSLSLLPIPEARQGARVAGSCSLDTVPCHSFKSKGQWPWLAAPIEGGLKLAKMSTEGNS